MVDHTAIGTSDHVFPLRRISPACRMSAKDLTRLAHRRFVKVRSRRVSPIAANPREGLLTEPTPAVRSWPREWVFMPLSGPSVLA